MNFVNNEYNAGLAAKAAGKPRTSNPFTNDGVSASYWYKGWDAGVAPTPTTVTKAPEKPKVDDGKHES